MVKSATEIWRDKSNPADPNSEDWKPVKSDIREWGFWLENVSADPGYSVKTWAALNAIVLTGSNVVGLAGEVVGPDSGTHTDPSTGATVANEGRYSWTTSGWTWISATTIGLLGDLAFLDTVGTTNINNLSITENKLVNGSVTNPKLAVDAVSTSRIVDTAVSKPKLSVAVQEQLDSIGTYTFSVGDSTSAIFVGDSLTAGFGAMANKGPIQKISAYTNILCHNYGRPGYKTENLLTSLRTQSEVFLGNVQQLRPKYGMILTGANDTGTFDERTGVLQQLGETLSGQGCEVSFTRSNYWIGGEQSSMMYSSLAERFGGDFVDVRRAYNLFCLTGVTPGFWYNNHPGTRTNDIFAGPLSDWIQKKDCQQSIKIFRARNDDAAIEDLNFYPYDFYSRDQLWREIVVGERSIDTDNSSMFDAIQDGFPIVDRNSEYMSLIKGNSLNMGKNALVVITLPANAANLESVKINIGADVDTCYYYNPISSPYAAAGEPVGNWASVTVVNREFTFTPTYLSRAVWGDQIVLLLKKSDSIMLSAPIVTWQGRVGKSTKQPRLGTAAGQYLTSTDAGSADWTLSDGAVRKVPSDGSLPAGCTKVIALDAGETASQVTTLPAESVLSREVELTIWVRRPPTVAVGINSADTAKVSVGLSSGTLNATVPVVAGLWWRECKVRLTIPPGISPPSIIIGTDRSIEFARGGVALVGAGNAAGGGGDPSEAATVAQQAAVVAMNARDQAALSAADAAQAADQSVAQHLNLESTFGREVSLGEAVTNMRLVSVETFGVVAGLTANPADNDVAIAAALLFAATSGATLLMTAPVYVFSATIDIPAGVQIIGGGMPRWIPGYTAAHPTFGLAAGQGTIIVFKGTGPRVWTVDNISSNGPSGGIVNNPSAGDAYTTVAPSPHYALADFTRADASGATRATLRPFSVGIRISSGGGVSISGIMAVPWLDGITGYGDDENTGLGADWDVGIWLDNSAANSLRDVGAVGYWRLSAWLKTLVVRDPAIPVYGEADRIYNPKCQGFRGLTLRAADVFRVISVTASTIKIPWTPGHRFDLSGRVRVSGADYAYTGLVYSSDQLTFTGVTPDASSLAAGVELRRAGSSFGTSGTQIFAPYITDLMHHTRLLPTSPLLDSAFPHMGQALEISGEPLRAIQFWGGTVIGRDDVLAFLKDCTDTIFFGTYFEGQPARAVVGGTSDTIGRGGRIIAQKSSDSLAPYPSGQVQGLRWTGCTFGPGVDRLPFVAESSGATRFTTPGNLYKPREDFDDNRAFPATTNGETRIVSLADARIHHADGGKTFIGPTTGNSRLQSRVGELNLESGLRVTLGHADGTKWVTANAGAFYPSTSGALTLGAPGYLWAQGYSTNSAFSTSDARMKEQNSDIPDVWLNAWGAVRWVRFKMKEAVALKGATARWHLGLIAQEIVSAFEAAGIPEADLLAVGLIGFDQWSEETEPVQEIRPVLDADGAETGAFELVDTGERRLVRAAGDAWSVRYEEALALEAAWSRREISRLAARVDALEGG